MYFRRRFNANDVSRITNVTVRLIRDDGAVAYLNGSELFRNNMPTGAVAYMTFAASVVASSRRLLDITRPN